MSREYIQQQIDEIDKFIAEQEFEGAMVEDNILDNKCFDSGYISPSGYQVSEDHVFSIALLVNFIKEFHSQNSVPDYPILFEMLRIIFNDIEPSNALTFAPLVQAPLFVTNVPRLSIFESILSRNQINSNVMFSRLRMEFVITDNIGHGAWGTVIRAKHHIDRTEYAIKKINIPTREDGNIFLREVRLLARLEHENINRYHTAWVDYEPKKSANNGNLPIEREISTLESEESSHESNNNTFTETIYPTVFNDPDQSDQFVILKENQNEPLIEIKVEHENSKESSKNGISKEISSNGDFIERIIQHETPPNSSSNSGLSKYPLAINTNPIFTNRRHSLYRYNSYPSVDSNCSCKPYIPKPLKTNTIAEKQTIQPEVTYILCIQLELCETNLGQWLLKRNDICRSMNQLTDKHISTAKNYTLQLFRGLNYLHSKGIIHRDIKPANILLMNNLEVLKICDFGLSKDSIRNGISDKATNHTSHIGTRKYSSPEQLSGRNYTTKTDIFSSGLLMVELFHPFTTESEKSVILTKAREKITTEEFKFKFPFESNLITQMVNSKWEERPTAFKLLMNILENESTEDNQRELIKLLKSKIEKYELDLN